MLPVVPVNVLELLKAKFKNQPGYQLGGWPARWKRTVPRLRPHLLRHGPVTVSEITGTELPLGRTVSLKWAMDNVRDHYTNADTGWEIHVYAQGLKETVFRHGQDFRALAAIPQLIENCVLFAQEPFRPDPKLRARQRHIFYAPLRIGNDDYVARLTVIDRIDTKKQIVEYRMFHLGTAKTERFAHDTAGAEAPVGTTAVSEGSEPFTVSISRLIESVKKWHPEHAPSMLKAIRYVARFE